MTKLSVAYSPCPNDTFIFQAWALGLVSPQLPMQSHLGDIQHLNEEAIALKHDVCKISFANLGLLLEDYILLPVGCALGYGCGPKIISKTPFKIQDLTNKKIAIPGNSTTAHLMLKMLCDVPLEKHFCTYDQVLSLIDDGQVDCGIIIHETRFTFEQQGFHEIVDLGIMWESCFSLPIPLGGIVAKRSLGIEKIAYIVQAIKDSMEFANSNTEIITPYIQKYAQELTLDVLRSHINLYVTKDSYNLSEQAIEAIKIILKQSEINQQPLPWLFNETINIFNRT
ncbi:MAG: 1,4-dihydroxy-6-naphthoate synthase [Parachlamydiales bacterium]|nr:1,4-dihydroxy-6-naphthoate synthase [Parachlamydiales bacterium]